MTQSLLVQLIHVECFQCPLPHENTISIGLLSEGTYQLSYFVACSDTPTYIGNQIINFCVGQFTSNHLVNQADNNPLVYPNPATNEIHIDFKTDAVNNYEINFYSMQGQKVKTIIQYDNNSKIDISNLTDGIYFIVISDNTNINWSYKIVKSSR